MKKKLLESVEVQIIMQNSGVEVLFQNLVSEWTGMPYAELSVILAALRALSMLNQTHHWCALGDSFYGDHLLFMRIYDAIADEVDTVAEKAVGVGCIENVNIELQCSQVTRLVSQMSGVAQTIPQRMDLVKKSHLAEIALLQMIDCATKSLNDSGLLTGGVENMLQGISDKHESHVYLLKQRCSAIPTM